MDRPRWIEATLREAFVPDHLEIEDESARHVGHAGAAAGGGHFRVLIVSASFRGQSPVARHSSVYAALGNAMKTEIHALALRTLTPEEWKREGDKLDAVERASSASFVKIDDLELPACFSSVEREWTAVRQGCGLLDARFRGLLRMNGGDRTTFLQGMVTNDVARLGDGSGTYAALLTQQGKVVSDLRVYALADEIWLDTPYARTAAVRESLERFIIADDVEFAADDVWAPLVALEGPEAGRILIAVTGTSPPPEKPFTHHEVSFSEDVHLHVAAVSHGGESGYLLFGMPGLRETLWQRCCQAGAEPVGMDALDVLRVEAGIPWYSRDMDDSMLISEVGLDSAISYSKGCYLGQEVVERVAARGQVHRRLVGLQCEGSIVPPADSKLMHGGNEVGWITSAVWSFARQAVIALGYLRREYWEAGSEVEVTLGATTTAARVVPLPFI